MSRKDRPLRLALALLATMTAQVYLPVDLGAAEIAKPNLVYILADELGYFEVSHLGHPHVRTPNIDRLAREGIRFTQGLAGSSLCAPTRCTLMTGKHSGRTSVRTNGGGTPLRAGEETIASVLKRVGYATGGFGKWGCGGRGSTGVPEKHGFDRFVGYYDQVHAHTYYPAYLIENSRELPLEGNRGGRSGKTYSQYVIVEEAKRFIRAHRDEPFFCYLPVTPPHGLFDIPDSDPAWSLYAEKPWPEDARRYAAMVSMLDRQVGEILALIEEFGLDERTLVFFSGDNGGNDYFPSKEHPRGFHAPNVDPRSGVAFRGQKGTLYEGGLRVPMIARWPGRIEAGRVSEHLWYFPDVLPTFAELAGAKSPEDIDGISIVPELLGAKVAGREQTQHEYLYWELGGQIAVREGVYKAVRPKEGRRESGEAAWELYDLRRDPSEAHDLAAEKPEVLARLQAFAGAAHTPAVEGEFHDRTLHERDRAAKWGEAGPPGAAGAAKPAEVNALPTEGLIARTGWKIARASSESVENRRLARHAIDGDPRTHWHTRWVDSLAKHPHELVVDLGRNERVAGVVCLSRQDGSFNGSIGRCELYVSDSAEDFGEALVTKKLAKTREPQKITCAPVKGRYVRLRILDEVDGGPWASLAELGVLGGGR